MRSLPPRHPRPVAARRATPPAVAAARSRDRRTRRMAGLLLVGSLAAACGPSVGPAVGGGTDGVGQVADGSATADGGLAVGS